MGSGRNRWRRAVALVAGIAIVAGLSGGSAGVSASAASGAWALDATFGDNGTARISVRSAPNESWDTPGGVAVQSDNKIVVVGSAGPNQVDPGDIVVLRRLADGRPDPSFGNSGTTILDFGGSDIGAGAVIQPDGKIVVVGGGGPSCTTVAARLRRDGSLDSGFGNGGKVMLNAGQTCYVNAAVALQGDGGIIVMSAGRLLRLTAIGTLDPAFGTDGVVALPDGLIARAIAVQSDGAVLVGGEGPFGLYRYGPDGSLDTSFGSGGLASVPVTGNTFVNAIAIEADGDVVAGGAEYMGEYVFRLARWNPSGNLDTGFGQNGQVRTSFYDIGHSGGTPVAELTGLAALADGKLVASGRDIIDHAFARYNADGSLDSTFGAGGRLDVIVDNYAHGAEAMALQSDGGIVTLGRYSGIKFHLSLTRLSTGPIGTPTTTTTAKPTTTTTATTPPGPSTSTTTTTGPTGSGPTTTTTIADSTPTTPSGGGDGSKAAAPRVRSGYWMVTATGEVHAFGDAKHFGDPQKVLGGAKVVHIEPTSTGNGYWILDNRGRVHPFGNAVRLGDIDPSSLGKGEMAMTLSATPSGAGYWVFTNRGRVLAYGDAPFLGDMLSTPLNGPVVGSVATPSGRGYYLVASDGGIFSFGDAAFHGSTGNLRLNKPVMGMAAAPGGSYWLVASDGGIFAFDAPFHGSMGSVPLNRPISGLVPGSDGYLMVAEDGGIFSFGSVAFHGSLGSRPPTAPVVSAALLR